VGEGRGEIKALDARWKELEAQLRAADEPPPLLHRSMADLYKSKVEELAALQREDTRGSLRNARGLIEAIVSPGKG
jgi:site-specific DNA recombinase